MEAKIIEGRELVAGLRAHADWQDAQLVMRKGFCRVDAATQRDKRGHWRR
jgi:hypothetical protein